MGEQQIKRTEISELGEFGLIDHLTKDITLRNKSSVKGVGDDAAVVDYGGKPMVVTTDLLIEGVHFDLMYHPLKHLGYKAVIVNLSDVFAMNAIPKQITVSLAISNRFSVEAVDEIYEGIFHACELYNVDLVGGDTTSSRSGLVISITALGEGEKERLTYRNSAKEGDLICVSGDLGAAYLGLQLLEREKQIYLENPKVQPDLEEQRYIVGRQLKPEARGDIVEQFRKENIIPTAMIDISDGLSSDLMHIANSSDLGCEIYEESVPIHPEAYDMAMKFNIAPITCALNGGEDYELLFTLSPDDEKKILGTTGISIIGTMLASKEGMKIHTKGGKVFDLKAQGWNSFERNA